MINQWMIVFGIGNLLLLVGALLFFVPKTIWKNVWGEILNHLSMQYPYLFLVGGVVGFHLIEVNIIDPWITSQIGTDYALVLVHLEGNLIGQLPQLWHPFLVIFFVIIYIIVYPFTLWFSPLYFLVAGKQSAMKSLAYGLLIIYLFAIPFYLFLPVTNVYTYTQSPNALSTVFPGIEHFFYTTTTCNNCFPSLHVAMTILIAFTAWKTQNQRYFLFTSLVAIMVIISVMYLAIHWITDVLGGAAIALFAIGFFITLEKKKKNESKTN